MLEVRDLETAYGDSQVLFGMELAVEAGQAVTLMGRTGMGKTTPIRSIMGLTPARAGSITFDGVEIRVLSDYKIAQLGLGLVPEGRQIFPNLTAREPISSPATSLTASSASSRAPWRWPPGPSCCCSTSRPPAWGPRIPSAFVNFSPGSREPSRCS